MNPTVEQIKAWRKRHNLTAFKAGEILGVSNYRRYVSPHPQRLPAPNWFRGCAWSVLSPSAEWREFVGIADSGIYPEVNDQSSGVRFVYVAHALLPRDIFLKIREEMSK